MAFPVPEVAAPAVEPMIFSVPEVAALLKVTDRYVYKLIERNELRSFKVGKLRRVSRDEINAYIKGRQAVEAAERVST